MSIVSQFSQVRRSVPLVVIAMLIAGCGSAGDGRGLSAGQAAIDSSAHGFDPLADARALPPGHPPLPGRYGVLPEGHPALPPGHPPLSQGEPRCPASGAPAIERGPRRGYPLPADTPELISI